MNNVHNFGACGNGKTNDTMAIQRAIDAGGVVYFPRGIYRSGTLYLKSNGGLHLGEGAVLLASKDSSDYNKDDFSTRNVVFAEEKVSGAHFIIAEDCRNITLFGKGCIDGNRKEIFSTDEIVTDLGRPHYKLPQWRPGQMVFFLGCSDVTIKDLTLRDAPYWTCFLHGCSNVYVEGLNVRADRLIMNADGLDIDCCQKVTVRNCDIDCGDDAIAVRANEKSLGKEMPCCDVVISDCTLRSPACAVRLGVGCGKIRDCCFSRLKITDSTIGIGLCPSFSRGRCVTMENCVFENCEISGRQTLLLLPCWDGSHDDPAVRPLRNFRFRNIKAVSQMPSVMIGHDEKELFSGFAFENISLKLTSPTVPPLKRYWPEGTEYGLLNILHMSDTTITGFHGESDDPHPSLLIQ